MDDNKMIKVVNRVRSVVGYFVPDMNNLHRDFNGREEKILPFEELRKLSYVPGGDVILKDYLIIKDKEAIEALNLNIEPEYFYEEEDVKRIMTEGSMDEFLDCLDFAPDGVIDIMKELAVEMPLNDVMKREAIEEKTGFNIEAAIRIRRETEETKEEKKPTTRRAGAANAADQSKDPQTKTRRTTPVK